MSEYAKMPFYKARVKKPADSSFHSATLRFIQNDTCFEKTLLKKYALSPSMRSREGLWWEKKPFHLKHYP